MLVLLGKEGLPVCVGGSPIDLQKEMIENQLLERDEACHYDLTNADTIFRVTKSG